MQKIFDRVKDRSEFELAFDELSDNFENIVKSGHTGVILSICKACKRLNCRQIQFSRLLKSVFGQSEFVTSVLKMKPTKPEEDTFIHVHGSVILQTMLHFLKPIDIVNALLALENDKLVQIVGNVKGSYIVDAFFAAPFVGEKSKIKLIRKFEVKANFLFCENLVNLSLFLGFLSCFGDKQIRIACFGAAIHCL